MEKLITPKEACDLLNISRSMLTTLVKDGIISEYRLTGRTFRYRPSVIFEEMTNAISKYVTDVKDGDFPNNEEQY